MILLFSNIKINQSIYVFILLKYRKIIFCRDFDVLLETCLRQLNAYFGQATVGMVC